MLVVYVPRGARSLLIGTDEAKSVHHPYRSYALRFVRSCVRTQKSPCTWAGLHGPKFYGSEVGLWRWSGRRKSG